MSKKYYGVKLGKKIGIYENWEDCRINVIGYPNSQYKSFYTYEEANIYVYEGNQNKFENEKNYDIVSYIDGSYDNSQKAFSYAGVIFYKKETIEFAYVDKSLDLVELRNVAGELKAAMYVMDYGLKNNVKSIAIHYDYIGIENWANKNWKANLKFTKEYVAFTERIMKKIDIDFIKVKAHTGNKYNERADELAKKALKDENKELYNDNNLKDNILEIEFRKKSLNFGVKLKDDIITMEKLYIIFKEKWKQSGRKLNEILGQKGYYDVKECKFVVIVKTDYGIVKIDI